MTNRCVALSSTRDTLALNLGMFGMLAGLGPKLLKIRYEVNKPCSSSKGLFQENDLPETFPFDYVTSCHSPS
jgi:hypothetical protein